MAKTKDQKTRIKPWMSVDEALNVLALGYKDGFTAADLHDLIQGQQLNIYAYFIGHALEFEQVHTGVERPFGNPVIGIQLHQDYILLPAVHTRLRTTLCGNEVDMPELRHGFLKLPDSSEDTYQMLHKPAILPSTETVGGVTHLTETITIPSFTRQELFLRSSDVYGYLGEEAADQRPVVDAVSNKTMGCVREIIKAMALTITENDEKQPSLTIARNALNAIVASGRAAPKITEETLADYIAQSKYKQSAT